ncbi:MAG: nucleotidyltransferase domain-containing protein [Bacteroidales bacterium]|nr:nucleotidyltransferase domain-containing protein [Bacteroidales bacterium]
MTRNEIITELSTTASKVLPTNAEAWLFGSQARGTATSESDWDVLVLLDKDAIVHTDFGQFAYPFIETGWDVDAMVSPILLSKKEWAKSSFTPFYKNVMNERIRL